MYAVMSKFAVANGLTQQVKDAFRARPHLVDRVAGFIRLDVLSPLDHPDEIWLITYWIDAESFQAWHRSELHHESHAGIPKGLKLVRGATEIRSFEHVCS